MPTPSQLRAAARLIAILGVVGLCAGAAMARSIPQPQFAALGPMGMEMTAEPTLTPSQGPFGLAVANSGALSKIWQSLQPVIRVEARILALCRSIPEICPPAASRFLDIIEGARARTGRDRVGEVNRAVNLAIRPMSDLAKFGVPDVWATPLMTFATGTGDCEDYAIAKYVALSEAGIATEDLRLVIVHDRRVSEDHAVVAARVDGRWLILDNRHMNLLSDMQVRNVTPLFALGSDGESLPPPLQ